MATPARSSARTTAGPTGPTGACGAVPLPDGYERPLPGTDELRAARASRASTVPRLPVRVARRGRPDARGVPGPAPCLVRRLRRARARRRGRGGGWRVQARVPRELEARAGEPQRRIHPACGPRVLHLGGAPAAGPASRGLLGDRHPPDAPERRAAGGLGAHRAVDRAVRPLLDGRLPRRQPAGGRPRSPGLRRVSRAPSRAGWGRRARRASSASCAGTASSTRTRRS